VEVTLIELTCKKCHKTWTPRSDKPIQCPHCKTYRFSDAPPVKLDRPTAFCKRCKRSWHPRIKDPVQCPYCKSARFNEDPEE